MLQNFKVYQASLQFYHECEKLHLPAFLKDQLLRAASSVSLNLAEGAGRKTSKDQTRFYRIALGSINECSAILDLKGAVSAETKDRSQYITACLIKLTR